MFQYHYLKMRTGIVIKEGEDLSNKKELPR
nr:MAG TPA: hypothetical protein [Caudoviricetes sp.]